MARSPHDSPENAQFTRKKNALYLAIGASLFAFFLQVVGAWYSGSLALFGDTAHVFTDLFSLVMSLVAVVLAARPANHQQSFGLYRLEVLAAFLNGLLLIIVAVGLAWEGVERLLHPQPVLAKPLLLFAFIGLLFNLISALFLSRALKGADIAHHHHHAHFTPVHDHGHDCNHHQHPTHSHGEDRNLHGALLHVLSDALSSVAVIAGAVVMHYTAWFAVDAVLGIILAVIIFRWALRLLIDSGHVLIESTPKHIEPQKIKAALQQLDTRVASIEDLHVWEITSQMYAATAEVIVASMSLEEAEKIRVKMNELLQARFGIAHAVLALRPRV